MCWNLQNLRFENERKRDRSNGGESRGRDEAKRTECVFDANAKSESGKRGILSIVESRVGSPKIFSPSILPAPRGPILPRFEIGHVPDSSDARIRDTPRRSREWNEKVWPTVSITEARNADNNNGSRGQS